MRRVDRPAAADETWPAGHLRPLRLRRRAHPGASKWASHAQEAHALEPSPVCAMPSFCGAARYAARPLADSETATDSGSATTGPADSR